MKMTNNITDGKHQILLGQKLQCKMQYELMKGKW